MKYILTFLLALAVLTWQLSAQTSPQLVAKSNSEAAIPTSVDADSELANAKFAEALKWLKAGDIHVRGRLSTESKSDFGGGMIIMGGGPTGEPYKGDFIGHLAADGNLWLTSKEVFPGFSMRLGESRVIQVTYDEAAYNLDDLASEMEALLNAKRLNKYGSKAEWSAKRDATSSNWILEAELPKKIIPKKGGMMMGFSAQPMEIKVRMELKADGSVPSIKFSVLKSDPFADIQKQMDGGGFGDGVVIGGDHLPEGAGSPEGGKFEIPSGDDSDAEKKPGATTVYQLRLSKKAADKRIVGFQKFCSTLQEESDF